jgi:hypothetical protein
MDMNNGTTADLNSSSLIPRWQRKALAARDATNRTMNLNTSLTLSGGKRQPRIANMNRSPTVSSFFIFVSISSIG